MNQIEILKAARALILDPQAWTQNVSARNQHGVPVDVSSPQATCFCALGAIFSLTNDFGHEDAVEALSHEVWKQGCGIFVAEFNDTHTHTEVIALFDKAIASLEAQHGE